MLRQQNWPSKHLGVLQPKEVIPICQRAQCNQIGAEDSGEVDQAVVEVEAVAMMDLGVEDQEVEDHRVDVVVD